MSKYGWLPDVPDHRDYLFAKLNKIEPEKLPSSVDLRQLCPPVYNQLTLGSCTANALCAALGVLEIKHKDTYTDLSRLMLYYDEREIEGTINSDPGAQIRDGIKSLAERGVCREALWPYDIGKWNLKPTDQAYKEAMDYEILEYQRINTLDEMKQCLADGYPFAFGFAVYQAFESPKVAQTGIVPMPSGNEKSLGGHAVLAVGYDDSKQMFLVRNSWGNGWGIGGYFWMPYQYLNDRNLSDDFWTIRTDRTDINSPSPSPVPPAPWYQFMLDLFGRLLGK